MKIIDLLNKIAKGEMPKKIKYDNKIWYMQDNYLYCCEGVCLEEYCNILLCLNDEVEIIEEEHGIEEIHMCTGGIMGFDGVENITGALKDKINELVRTVNEMKKK